MEIINDLLKQAGNLSTGALVIVGVLVLGYVIRAIPQMPNGVIPVLTLGLAVTLQILMGDRSQVDYTVHNPEVRMGMVGVVYWAIGWLIHNQGLSRLEKFLPAPLRGLLGVETNEKPQSTEDKK